MFGGSIFGFTITKRLFCHFYLRILCNHDSDKIKNRSQIPEHLVHLYLSHLSNTIYCLVFIYVSVLLARGNKQIVSMKGGNNNINLSLSFETETRIEINVCKRHSI